MIIDYRIVKKKREAYQRTGIDENEGSGWKEKPQPKFMSREIKWSLALVSCHIEIYCIVPLTLIKET